MCKICLNPEHKNFNIEDALKVKAASMNDKEKSAYAAHLDKLNFENFLYTPVNLVDITGADWEKTARAKYPSLKNIEHRAEVYRTCTEPEVQRIIALDWTNLHAYSKDFRCGEFAETLRARLASEYGITAALEVWGYAGTEYHSFLLIVLKALSGWVAKLIEPQQDVIFDHELSPLGLYLPEKTK
jgi:hypothetical protein